MQFREGKVNGVVAAYIEHIQVARLITTFRVIAPILGKVQSDICQGTTIPIAHAGKHGHQGIVHFPRVAAILPAHANAFLPFLCPAAFINDERGKFLF